MQIFSQSAAPSRRKARSVITGLALAGSLLLAACDMGGTSTPTSNNPNPPTVAQPGNSNSGGNSNASGFQPGGNAPSANTGGPGAGTGGDTSTVTTGGTSASFAGQAGASPINGTDPASQPIVQMVRKVSPAICMVVNRSRQGEARGSGAVIDQKGYIVTNNHVVEGQSELYVIFSDGQPRKAQLVGTAPTRDVAVLYISGGVPGVLPMGDSDKLLPGETVVAIGSALGEFYNSVTVGVVSGLNRSLPESDNVTIDNLIQTDAAINHGNSGGPLLNLDGELIGINTLGVTDAGQNDIAQGLGFAIASNSVKTTVNAILKQAGAPASGGAGTTVTARPYLGVRIQNVDVKLAGNNGLTDPTTGNLLDHGALVTEVVSGGPAQAAGVQAGDVIVGVNDQAITRSVPLSDILINFKAGDKVVLHVIRGGQSGTINVTLGQAP
jgi:2-alkenal reductase